MNFLSASTWGGGGGGGVSYPIVWTRAVGGSVDVAILRFCGIHPQWRMCHQACMGCTLWLYLVGGGGRGEGGYESA